MLSEQQLYTARREAALAVEVILLECGVRNDVKYPAALSAELAAEPPQPLVPITNTPTLQNSMSGDLSDLYNGATITLCQADGYNIMPSPWFRS
jgi:hypothetical protein